MFAQVLHVSFGTRMRLGQDVALVDLPVLPKVGAEGPVVVLVGGKHDISMRIVSLSFDPCWTIKLKLIEQIV